MINYDRNELIRYLIDNTPIILDMNSGELIYDPRDIHYKIYKYIRELEKKGWKICG